MDRALWITWYDLQEEKREAYCAWLHQTYLPRLLERTGILWAAHYASEDRPIRTDKKDRGRRYPPPGSVAEGYHFLVLIGGESADDFAHPAPRQFHERLPAADRNMLALRAGVSTNIMIEQARVCGPDAKRREPGSALSPCIQLGSFVFDGDEEDLFAWYAQWRLPSMTEIPGCVGVRKLVSVAGWAKHGILHEFTSIAARNENFVNHEQTRHPERAAWSEMITGQVIHAPGSPNVARRIWSAVKR